MSDSVNPRKWKTPPFRMSFPHLLTPRKDEESGRETFQLSQLYPGGTDFAGARAAMKAAMVEKYGDNSEKWPKLRRGPNEVIRDAKAYSDGRDKPIAGYDAGWSFIRANATLDHPPAIVGPIKGADGKFPIIREPREIYAGRWARATLEAFVYERKDGKGVTFGLLNVQLLKHDTRLGGAVSDPHADYDNASEEWSGGGDDFGAQPDANKAKDEAQGW